MKLLTAIVPVHKMAGRLGDLKSWVREALELDIQVILIHDFGDAETDNELINFAEGQEPSGLKLLRGHFGGPGLARNAGIQKINSRYFCFWDSDDIPLVENFKSMVEEAELRDIEIVVGEYETIEEDSRKIGIFEAESKDLVSQVAMNPGLWRMAFKTQLCGQVRFRNMLLAEDQIYLAELDFPSRKIDSFHKSVYQYKVNSPNSLTKQRRNLNYITESLGVVRNLLTSTTRPTSRIFLLILWLKQSLTLVKLGDVSLKLIGVTNLLLILRRTNLSEKYRLVNLTLRRKKFK